MTKIDYSTIRPGGPPKNTATVADRRWWLLQAAAAPNAITGCLQQVEDQEKQRHGQLIRSARLYGNTPVPSVYGFQQTQTQAMADRLSCNVSQSATDTITSKIGKNKPRPFMLTTGGDNKKRSKAKKLNKFNDGVFYANKTYDLGLETFRDACVLGSGMVHPYVQGGKIKHERVLCSELRVDEMEAQYGNPRQMHREKMIDRFVLADAFPKHKKLIMDATSAWLTDASTDRPHFADMLLVRESWHLPSGPDAKDGKRIVTLPEGPLTEMCEWNHDFFPFAHLRWSKRIAGYWGQGLIEQGQPIQLEINKLLYLAQRSYHLAGSYKILMEMGSKIAPEHLNNQVGAVIKYQGAPPQYIVPPILPPEVYQHLQWLFQRYYDLAGVPLLNASGEKPSGLNSGRALREYNDINTDRFQSIGKGYERLYLDLADMDKALLRDILESGEANNYTVQSPSDRWLDPIDLTKKDLIAEDECIMQCFPVSSLPNEPAGRLETVQEMMQAGLVDPRTGKKLLNFPDIQQEETLSGAAEDFITKKLDEMIEDEGEDYEQYEPEPWDNPADAYELAHQYYLAGKRDNLEEEKLDRLRTFMTACRALEQQAAAAMAPPPGQPQAQPEAPPTSPMIQNAPGITQGAA